ncbi:MAG: ATP synthase F1 subunit delta [Candidatus Melainabacteria bacterium]|nr:ATP synthase F1 subunit delta [Candidatus Melainabacteria bacterium]
MQESKQVSRNYAQALIELSGGDLGLQECFLSEIKAINESISQVKGAKQIFENPSISKDEKKELLKKLLDGKINQINLSFLFLLIDKQRFNLLPEIQNQLIKVVNKNKGMSIAKVTSASELDSVTLETIRQKLENLLGKSEKVTIESKIEPGLLGGVVVKINDLVYDGSIKGKLENLKRRLES